jgi:hypothetical protein
MPLEKVGVASRTSDRLCLSKMRVAVTLRCVQIYLQRTAGVLIAASNTTWKRAARPERHLLVF